jgi:hypothetical protein
MALLGLGALVLVTNLATWGDNDLVAPLLLVGGGLAVIWRQLDTDRHAGPARRPLGAGRRRGAGRDRPGAAPGHHRPAGQRPQRLRRDPRHPRRRRAGHRAVLAAAAGLREEERTARIRSEERAAVAAHLHDSVLQTLALIQRHAGDQQAVARLARSQERELRSWLYEPAKVTGGGTWASLVSQMVAEVEADHELTVDRSSSATPRSTTRSPPSARPPARRWSTRQALGRDRRRLYTEVTRSGVGVRPRRGPGSTRPRCRRPAAGCATR